MESWEEICDECNGDKLIINKICPKCEGTGVLDFIEKIVGKKVEKLDHIKNVNNRRLAIYVKKHIENYLFNESIGKCKKVLIPNFLEQIKESKIIQSYDLCDTFDYIKLSIQPIRSVEFIDFNFYIT